MANVGEDVLRHIVEAWQELGDATKIFFEDLAAAAAAGEVVFDTVSLFVAALFGEEAAAALLALGVGGALGVVLDAFVSCIGSL